MSMCNVNRINIHLPENIKKVRKFYVKDSLLPSVFFYRNVYRKYWINAPYSLPNMWKKLHPTQNASTSARKSQQRPD